MPLSAATFDELRRQIQRLCGLALGADKGYLIEHRLGALLKEHGLRDFDELAGRLRQGAGGALHDTLVELITTPETSFFRDGHPFQALRRQVLPGLIQSAQARGGRVRLWSAACATGQEAYSLAMLLLDHVQENPSARERDFGVLASDVSERVLGVARRGGYSERELARGLTPAQISRYFVRRGASWVVSDAVRRLVEFRRLNLTQPFVGLGQFDLILCRNVLMYFDEATRRRTVGQLQEALYPGGWLLLGSAENLYGLTDGFESVHLGETLLYRKRSD